MWLLIDDVRDLNCDVIARNGKAAMKMLELGGWNTVCFDHDLGNHEATGYEILNLALDKGLLCEVNHIQLVTSNPVGRKNMEATLLDNGFTTLDGCNFYRN